MVITYIINKVQSPTDFIRNLRSATEIAFYPLIRGLGRNSRMAIIAGPDKCPQEKPLVPDSKNGIISRKNSLGTPLSGVGKIISTYSCRRFLFGSVVIINQEVSSKSRRQNGTIDKAILTKKAIPINIKQIGNRFTTDGRGNSHRAMFEPGSDPYQLGRVAVPTSDSQTW